MVAFTALVAFRTLSSKMGAARGAVERGSEMGLSALAFFAVMHFVPEPAKLLVLYWGTWAATLIAVLGLRTPPAATWLFLWSLVVRNDVPNAMTGWDGLLTSGFFFLAFAEADQRFSLASRGRARSELAQARSTAWPMQMIRFQLVAVYLATAVLKSKVPEWVDGTYMLYVMIGDYARFPTDAWARVPILYSLGVAMTYGTLLVELFIPIGIFFERTRRWAIAIGLTLHLGIFVLMTIPHFSFVIGALYASALRARDFDELVAWARRHRSPPEPEAMSGT